MISHSVSTYLNAAEELTVTLITVIKRVPQQTRPKLAVHTEENNVVWRVLGWFDWPHQDYSEESTWTSIYLSRLKPF